MSILTEKITIEKLDDEHAIFYTSQFDCVNTNELSGLNKRERNKVKDSSVGMNTFLREEALEEQSLGLNTTFLMFYDDHIAGYISFCTDSIRLAEEKRESMELPYGNVPAIKIARLATDHRFQRKGIGKELFNLAVSKAFEVRESYCGVKFLTVDCHKHRLSYYQDKLGFQLNTNQEDADLYSLWLDIDVYLDTLPET